MATSVTLTNSSLLTNAEGTGACGDIVVVAGSFTLNNASMVSAATAGPQNAGTINITTTGNTVSLAGGSSITSSTTGAGNAGQIVITTPALTVDNGTITTSTGSSGNAGGITLTLNDVALPPFGGDGDVVHDKVLDRDLLARERAEPHPNP